MSTPSTNFEQSSFWKLLQQHPVQIPVIQRDYAQGREGKVKVLDGFLNALKDAVNGEPVELDFVYGDVRDDAFRPLDGQQRLTTLFLLHWYAARKAGLSLNDYAGTLGRFSYETRVSSRDFCHKLVREPIVIGNPANGLLSRQIKDFPWFVGAWEFDPTIAGMLAALDRISANEWPENLWTRITGEDAPPIRFVLVKLEKFGLSDDLYIKMNARGKPLTPFETFKALLGERVREQNWDVGLDEDDTFAIRVDTRWTDFFWRLCPADSSGLKRIDGAFLSFMAHSLACSMARQTTTAEAVADEIQNLLNDPEGMEPEQFTRSYCRELRERLDLLSEKPDGIRSEAREHWEFPEDSSPSRRSFLEEVIQNSGPQYKSRLILYAQLVLHKSAANVSIQSIAQWRRVVRNVVAHSVIERPESFIAGIRLIDELANGVTSILDFLATTEIHSGFASTQVEEEQRKARLLVQYPEQAKLLHRLEDTFFLRGRISFALDCVSEKPNPEKFDFTLLAQVASVIESEFGTGINSEIRRAFLTIGKGDFFHYWSSWFYAKNLPKYCLILDDREFRKFAEPNHPSRTALKAFVLELIGKSCAQLIASYEPIPGTPNWRARLIREKGLIDRATSHYIALDEAGAVVYPIPGIRPHDNAVTRAYLEANKIQ